MPIRRTILDQLSGSVRSMLAQDVPQRVLFMTGEAGIGKSTLITQLLDDLQRDSEPPIVAVGECSTPVAGSGVGQVEALKPFADIMAGLIEAGDASAEKRTSTGAARATGKGTGTGFKFDIGKFFVDTAPSWIGLIPVIGAPIFHALTIAGSGYDQVYLHNKLRTEGVNAAANQEQVFRQYINFLNKLSAEVPVLIVLDDFHWADTSSTNLLFAAARDLANSKVVFLVVYRSDDVKRSSSQNEHPLLHVRNEIERYSMCLSIEVPSADRADIRSLILMQYPSYVVNSELESWLLRITDGNLLFATQFLSTLERDAYLEPGTAVLLKDLATVPVPKSAHAVVMEQIRRLTHDDREHLRYASVEGETVTPSMVARFLDIPMMKVIQRLRMLSEHHQIIHSLGTQVLYAKETTAFQFVHYLVHKALYDELTQEERAFLHGVAVDVLEDELKLAEQSQHNVHIVAARLAAHATIAGRHDAAAEALLKGARWVWRSFAADEAFFLLEECQSAVRTPKNPSKAIRVVGLEACLLKAAIHQHRGRDSGASESFEEALALANGGELGTPEHQIDAHMGLSVVHWFNGRFEEAETSAQAALHLATESHDAVNRVRALRVLGNAYNSSKNYHKAFEYYQQSLDEATAIGDIAGRAANLSNLGNVCRIRRETAKALQHHLEALAIRRELCDTEMIPNALANVGNDYDDLGEYEQAMEAYTEALQRARTIGAPRLEGTILNNMSISCIRAHRNDEALNFALKSLDVREQIHDRNGVVMSLCTLGHLNKGLGRLDEAENYFTRCVEAGSAVNEQVKTTEAIQGIAGVRMLQGRPSDALTLFEQCAERFRGLGRPQQEIDSALGAVCAALKVSSPEPEFLVDVPKSMLLTNLRKIMPDGDLSEADGLDLIDSRNDMIRSFGIRVNEG